MLSRAPLLLSLSALALLGALTGAACSSSDTSSTGTTGTGGHTGTPGGPVKGPADAHCTKSQVTSEAACHPTAGTGGNSSTTSAGATTGAGGSTGAGGDASEYGATLENAQGDDDDCKYHIAWTSTDIYQNTDVTFTVVATTKTDGKPVATGELDAEAFLNDTHPAPNSDTKVTESPAGTYKIGPMRFDKAGKWTVRFHIHEECSDLTEDSPHGHVAFFVNVP
jgi:YtkA-like protein